MASRLEVCASASKKLAAANVKAVRAVVGMDGFVDEIIEVVDKRHSAGSYQRLATIEQFGKKITAAAGQSSNYELVVTQQKLGGNGPIMANALASIGLGVTYIGNLGYPAIHPVFQEMTTKAEVISIAEACHTDALEFQDGKLMLGKLTATNDVSWSNVVARVGREKLTGLVRDARLVGMVNWTMLPHMTEIWSLLLEEIVLTLPKANRLLFVDLADPEKRPVEDLRGALNVLQKFQEHMDVVLGLNLSESIQVGGALGMAKPADPEAAIEQTAAAIRAKLGLATVVIHPRKGAAAANKTGTAKFAGPFVEHPKISTGAGDHFNAGFVTGQLLGLTLEESLCTGTATSGYYVRNAISPSQAQLAGFIAELPAPQ
jgi:sugar/nucleoside kinase (ribokinase family)